MKKIIMLDPGHGGEDPGAITELTKEKEMALNIALQTREILRKNKNYEVYMTRETDEYISLPERCNFANKYAAHVFISIHLNAHDSPAAKGIEVFSFPGSIRGAQIRNAVYLETMRLFPVWTGRGAKEARFYVLRKSDMPACLIECGFITNEAEEKEIHKVETRLKFAEGIANGIDAYFAGVRG